MMSSGAFQATSLALLATPGQLLSFRLANQVPSQVEVSDRFHLKPLLRAVTFPHAAFVLALSEGAVRLVEVPPSGPAVEVRVQDLPRDAAGAAGRATINDRSPKGRLQGSEGQKVRLIQYARKVEAALRQVLAAGRVPLFLAATEPLVSIYHSVNSYPELVGTTILGSPDRSTDDQLGRRGADRTRPALCGQCGGVPRPVRQPSGATADDHRHSSGGARGDLRCDRGPSRRYGRGGSRNGGR